MEALYHYLDKFGLLKEEHLAEVVHRFRDQDFAAGTPFLTEGQTSRKIGFVSAGVFRVYYTEKDGTELTRYFVIEGQFVTDIDSFLHQKPSPCTIEAVVPSTVWQIGHTDFGELMKGTESFSILFHRAVAEGLLQKLENRSPLVQEDATTRYLKFLQDHQGVLQRVPLQYIASYLGITPQSLSRIRASL